MLADFNARLAGSIDLDRPARISGLTTFEWLIGLLLGAVLLSALARRIKVPYPTFLAIGGMLLAFVPSGPSWTLEPDLALALFVAPVLLDAAFDTSVRDLRDNWLPVSTLVFIAVGLPSFRGMRLRRRYLCSLILRSGHAGKFTQPA
jgi:hypothetical protein